VPQECPSNTAESGLKYCLTFSRSAMSESRVTSSGRTPFSGSATPALVVVDETVGIGEAVHVGQEITVVKIRSAM
jgi:hypothetical protein